MKKRIRAAAVLVTAAAAIAMPLLSGTGGTALKHPRPVVAHADEGDYNKLSVDLATATAFEDARNAVKSAEAAELEEMEPEYWKNIQILTESGGFGNVGLLVGPKGTSKNSDVWSVYQSKISIDNSQIKTYDAKSGSAFSKYKAFGGAVQKLNARSQKTKGSANSMQKGLDELSAAGAKLTNLGTQLIKEYNPAPLVLSFLDANELNTHPQNKLVALVNNNRDLRNLFSLFGTPTGFGVPMSFLIMGIGAFLLLVTSVLMTLINGRAAGENIRKMMVKVLLGCVAVPLIAKGLDAGINFLGDSAAVQANSPESNYVEQNLNLADWYACGFSLPSGVTLTIDEEGQFILSPDDVRRINKFTYKKVWGHTPTDKEMVMKMEMYYNQFKALPMGVGFSEPIARSTGKPWRTNKFYGVLGNFGSNKALFDGVDNVTEGNLAKKIGYFNSKGLSMAKSGSKWTVSGSGKNYGISPIAATNLMRTTFTGSSMTVNTNSVMGGVVFDVDNGPGVGTSKMSGITRFLATFAMIMAAMKGLFTVFAAGFGGVLSGSARGALGSSQGVGQAVGGVVALVGGVFGISIIMTMSFTLLDQMYGVMQTLLSSATGGNDILQPFKEVVEGWPLVGPLLGDAMKSVARFVLTIMCALTLPKFGGIPVTLFCQYLAELPNRFAERAQQIENKFTGDFRGGGRMPGSNAMALMGQAAASGRAQAGALMGGLGAGLGALAGYGMTKAGKNLEDKYSGKDTGAGEGSMSAPEETKPENAAEEAGALAQQGVDQSPDREGTQPESGGAESGGSDGGSLTENTQVEGNPLNETEKESASDSVEGASTEVDASETMSSAETDASDTTASQEQTADSSMSEQTNAADSRSEQVNASEQMSMNDSVSDQKDHTETNASATLSSRSDGAKADAGRAGSMSGGRPGAQGQGTKTPSSQGSGRSTMAGGSGGSPKALTREQKHNRNMMAIAKGLQAAGGHTTKGEAAAGVAAGLAHMAGGVVGAQNVTAHGVNAVRNYKQRQNDIRRGLPPNYTQTQRRQNAQAGRPVSGNRAGNAGQGSRQQRGPNADAARQSQMYAEALAREAEAREAQMRAREAQAEAMRRPRE